jgi:hypothetical protein
MHHEKSRGGAGFGSVRWSAYFSEKTANDLLFFRPEERPLPRISAEI